MRHTYTKNIYCLLKFKFNWVFAIFIFEIWAPGLRTKDPTRTGAQGHTDQPSLPRRGESQRLLPRPEPVSPTVPSPSCTNIFIGLDGKQIMLVPGRAARKRKP